LVAAGASTTATGGFTTKEVQVEPEPDAEPLPDGEAPPTKTVIEPANLTPKDIAVKLEKTLAIDAFAAIEALEKVPALSAEHPDNICLRVFDPEYFTGLSAAEQKDLLWCMNSGVANPDSGMGCYACQPADYDRFKPFFSKALAQYHGVAEDAKHVNDWSLEGVEGLPEGGVLDLAALGLPALSMRVRVGRNLKAFPLPGSMTREDRCNRARRPGAVKRSFAFSY
jgi:hypothetical protein